jgi:uncharacterized caspase-like protein
MTGGSRSIDRGLAVVEPPLPGILISYAAAAGTIASDGVGDHSPYTQSLLNYLEGPDLEINLLFRKVAGYVQKKTQGRQTPFEYGRLPSESIFLKTAVNQPAPETECDRLTASPYDSLRISSVTGVDYNNINLPAAEIACKNAVEVYPNESRIQFQYGRALNKAEKHSEAIKWYKKAADPQQAARWIEAALRAGSDFSRKEMRNNSDAWTLQFRIALQKRLKNTGVYNGTLDGQFGPETRRAIDAIFGKEL